jgi:hypothetical protein
VYTFAEFEIFDSVRLSVESDSICFLLGPYIYGY